MTTYFDKLKITERLRSGMLASGFGFSVNLVSQVALVPILLFFWGQELFGEWVILSAVPAYLSLSNLGFSDAMATEVTLCAQKGETHKAAEIFQSTWKIISALSIAVAACFILLLGTSTSVFPSIGVVLISESNASFIVALFMAHIILGIQFSLWAGPYRSVGRYPIHTAIINLSKLLELALGVVVVVLGYGPLEVVVAYVAVRAFFLVVLLWLIPRFNPWISVDLSKPNFNSIRSILLRTIICYALGNIFVNQGVIVVIGYAVGASAVSMYSVMRTLTRLVLKLAGIMNSNFMPEMSAAFASDDISLFRSLNRSLCQYGFWLVTCGSLFLLIFADPIIRTWTLNKIEYEDVLMMLIILEAIIYFVGYTGSVPLVAVNQHSSFVVYVIASEKRFRTRSCHADVWHKCSTLRSLLTNIIIAMYVMVQILRLTNDKLSAFATCA